MKAGWRLAKTVRKSVARDRRIFLYPLLSGMVSATVFILIFVSLSVAIPVTSGGDTVLFYIGSIFLAYILIAFFSTYILLSMLIAYRAFNSGNPITIRNSMRKAWKYRLQALEWSVFYSVLIMILRVIESRIRGIGGMVMGVMGSFMITIATFFAIPAILDNRSGPIKAVEQSVSTIRKNFGETFGGVAYVDLYTMAFTFIGVVLFILGLLVLSSMLPLIIVAVIVIVGLILMAIGLIFNFTYMNVLNLVLFDYINGKSLPQGFDEVDINAAIKKKGSRGLFNSNFSDYQNNF